MLRNYFEYVLFINIYCNFQYALESFNLNIYILEIPQGLLKGPSSSDIKQGLDPLTYFGNIPRLVIYPDYMLVEWQFSLGLILFEIIIKAFLTTRPF